VFYEAAFEQFFLYLKRKLSESDVSKFEGDDSMDLKIKPVLRANDLGTLFDPETGDSYTLNESGLLILKKLQAGQTSDEIFAELSADYDLKKEDFDRMILDFGSLLKSFQLLQDE